MAIKNNNNIDILGYVDWILKKKGEEPTEKVPYPFILNRWLSMVDPAICQVINMTCNRWASTKTFYSEPFRVGRFFYTVLSKTSKKYKYIKKLERESISSDDKLMRENYAHNMQISIREIQLYNKTLAELEKDTK